ncbi:MAG: hypothetical protein JO325_04740, partial [Solirubrobacterales bacterium]|nr:hypothetical protein [Solirubrobacterales bacterium]
TTLSFAERGRAEALDVWRAAADLVSTRWQMFLEADGSSRRWAFASYVAALDAEEAAAGDVEAFNFRQAA